MQYMSFESLHKIFPPMEYPFLPDQQIVDLFNFIKRSFIEGLVNFKKEYSTIKNGHPNTHFSFGGLKK